MPDPADADRLVVAFARVLRRAGLDVPVGATVTLGEAFAAVGLEQRDALYWAGRAVVLRRREDGPVYDAAFRAFWDAEPPTAVPAPDSTETITIGLDDDAGPDTDAPDEPDDGGDDVQLRVRWSPAELLRHRDFAACSPAELDEARRLIADLRIVGARRRSRRHRATHRDRGRPDLRRTVRRALGAGGEPARRAFRAPTDRPRRLVLLCDVSGSMEPYARAFLRFLHTAVVAGTRVEAFAVGTRVTRLTRELSSRDPDEALRAAAARVTDWSGGTRLGDGLRTFNDRWGIRGVARGAVVVVLSDGWDRGDPDLLGEQMARLHRVAHRVVWVNPLKATADYAPLARGMAAALPHVDEFVTGHSIAALEDLVGVLAR
ncbi:MAG TPA: VWA domain-containing protein [Acidimicrobiia bacterium]|nr:VWA domain-containing protein [Acidimicrobiia bacterium]